jgi:hypothetical protein
MHLSSQFEFLFRKETYAVNLVLMDDKDMTNPFDDILAHKPMEGLWDREYSLVPIGELSGRNEANKIPEKTTSQGYTAYGACAIEASGKVGLSGTLKERSREFTNNGVIDERRFAEHIADQYSRSFLYRKGQKWHKLAARIFNRGGIAAGNAFFNQHTRSGFKSDVPNSNLIYDGVSLFTLPTNCHPSYASGALIGNGAQPVGNFVDWATTIADTGGYFNAFQYPPSYWALKRVVQHMSYNMAFDDNDERFTMYPDTLLISSYNLPRWMEILKSRFIEPTAAGNTTNRENVTMMNVEGFNLRLVHTPYLVANTWFVGKANSRGVIVYDPTSIDEAFAYYRDEDDRTYWISYEDWWGFIVCNWRCWCAGSYSTDGETAPNYGAEDGWDEMPAGV